MFKSESTHELMPRRSSEVSSEQTNLSSEAAVYIACESLKTRNNRLQADKELLAAHVNYLKKQNQLLSTRNLFMSKSETPSSQHTRSPMYETSNHWRSEYVDNPRRSSAGSAPRHTSNEHYAGMRSPHPSRLEGSTGTIKVRETRDASGFDDAWISHWKGVGFEESWIPEETWVPRRRRVETDLGFEESHPGRKRLETDLVLPYRKTLHAQESLDDPFSRRDGPAIKETKLMKLMDDSKSSSPLVGGAYPLDAYDGVEDVIYSMAVDPPLEQVLTKRHAVEADVTGRRVREEGTTVLPASTREPHCAASQDDEDSLVVSLMSELRTALHCVDTQRQQLTHLAQFVAKQNILFKQLCRQCKSPCSQCGHLPLAPLGLDVDSNLAVGSGTVIVETVISSLDFDDSKIAIQCTSNPEQHLPQVMTSSPHSSSPPSRRRRPEINAEIFSSGIVARVNDIPQGEQSVEEPACSPITMRKSLEADISERELSGLDEIVDQSRLVSHVESRERSGSEQSLRRHDDSLMSNSYTCSLNLRVCPVCDKSFRSECEQREFEEHVEGHFEDNIVNDYEVVG